MKYKIYKKSIFFTLFLIIIISTCNVMAFNPDKYNPFSAKNGGPLTKADASTLFEMGEKVWGTLRNISLAVAFVTLAIIGLKYMFGSVDQKAEYKAKLLPWAIGVIMVSMIITILTIIQQLAQTLD